MWQGWWVGVMVVGVSPIQLTDMEGQSTVVDHRNEELPHELRVVSADLLAGDRKAVAEVGATGTIQGHLNQGLIQRCHEVTEAVDAAPIPQGLGQGLPHSNAHVLIGVVIVDVGVSHRIDLQIDQAMAADLMKHVVEKRHTGTGLTLAGTVQIKTHLHIGFTGDPMDRSLTCHHATFSALIVPHIPVTQ